MLQHNANNCARVKNNASLYYEKKYAMITIVCMSCDHGTIMNLSTKCVYLFPSVFIKLSHPNPINHDPLYWSF